MSLWSNNLLDGFDEINPPVNILKEQGEFLSKMTNNFVVGIPRQIRSSFETSNFSYVFRLEAPTINYSYDLLRIDYPITLYPLTLNFENKAIKVDTEQGFLNKLQEILTSPNTEDIVRSILAQTDYKSLDDVQDDIPF